MSGSLAVLVMLSYTLFSFVVVLACAFCFVYVSACDVFVDVLFEFCVLVSGDCCCCNGGVIFKSVKLQSVNLDGYVSVPSTVYCKSHGISFCSQSSMYLCNGGVIKIFCLGIVWR